MTVSKKLALGPALFFVLACASVSQPKFTPNSSTRADAKPSDCKFDVLTLPPAQPVDELGIIDFEGGATNFDTGRRLGVSDTAARLRQAVAFDVSRVGGDAVLGQVNGVGQYIRATVLRYRPEPKAATTN
jgi:hypothetical protein